MNREVGRSAAWIGGAIAVGGALLALWLSDRRMRGRVAHRTLKALPSGLRKVRRTVVIDRPRADIYAFWRDFRNLAPIMPHIERIEWQPGVNLSHWVARGPGGLELEWDTFVADDKPDERIAWRSLEGTGNLRNHGMLELTDSPGGRTEVSLQIVFDAPLGEAGRAVAWLAGMDPAQLAEEALLQLKKTMEGTGSITETGSSRPSSGAQPSL